MPEKPKTVLDILDEEDKTSAVPTDRETREIAGWVSKVQQLDEEMRQADSRLKSAKAERWHVVTVDLPLAFQQFNITRMDVAGLTLTLRPIVNPNVKKEDALTMHEWLIANGHGDLIKRVVQIPFGRGDESFDDVTSYLDSQGINYETKEGVAHNTLQAWARQMVEDGVELPDEVFHIWKGQECLLKERK